MPDPELSPAASSDLTTFAHRSVWVAQSGQDSGGVAGPFDSLPAGGGTLEADVCIVGAGIAGLTCAYNLVRAGRRVIVLEAGSIADGESSRTTAQLASEIDDRYFEIERLHGERGARLVAESQQAAIDFIKRTVAEEKIDCGFERVPGYLFLATQDPDDLLDRELVAAQRAGIPVERLDRTPLPAGAIDPGPCLKFAAQGQFDPLRYLAALAQAVRRLGGRIYPHVRAGTIAGDGTGARVEFTDAFAGGQHRGEIRAGAVIVATNTPYNDRVVMHTKQGAYRSYVVAVRVPKGSVERALFWDTLDPYHYVRLQTDDAGHENTELLIVGGEDHKTGQDDLPPPRCALPVPGSLDAAVLPGRGRGRLPLERTGDGTRGWIALHRAQPAGSFARVHRHGR